jgi:hypothetical protein
MHAPSIGWLVVWGLFLIFSRKVSHDQIGTSHSLSLHSPLRLSQKDERRYSVSGTPGDCAVMAARHL